MKGLFMPVVIQPPKDRDRKDWDRLYQGYAQFYGVVQTPAMRDTVWAWIIDANHPTQALLARTDAGAAVGLAHFRPYPRPLTASTGGFLDNLFVDPGARGTGVAASLIAAVNAYGQKQGWTVLRWITAQDNDRARRLYDEVAIVTPWVTYDIKR